MRSEATEVLLGYACLRYRGLADLAHVVRRLYAPVVRTDSGVALSLVDLEDLAPSPVDRSRPLSSASLDEIHCFSSGGLATRLHKPNAGVVKAQGRQDLRGRK